MRAARMAAYGPPELLAVEEVPDPRPGPGEVAVDVAAAAVNFPDLLIMNGGYQLSWPMPLTPGSEFAGTVAEAGPPWAPSPSASSSRPPRSTWCQTAWTWPRRPRSASPT